MTPFQIQTICSQFNLGKPVGIPTRVYGGLIHIMWRLKTDKNSYAIKQINVPLTEAIKQEFELTEQIAEKFKSLGIPAITSIKSSGVSLLTVEDTTFITYPWIDAKALSNAAVSQAQAIKIATILSQMHSINLCVKEVGKADHSFYSQVAFNDLFESAKTQKIELPDILHENYSRIIELNTKYIDAIPTLQNDSLISHGDLDQKNVLWDKDENPYLVDWESARLLNPTLELIMVALDWSGINTGNFDENIFLKIIQTYSANHLIDPGQVRPCLNGVLGNWINWLAHNVKQLLSQKPDAETQIALQQIQQTCRTINYIDTHFDEIIGTLLSSLIVY
jgi:thiamine kinase-like enzyme